ncbi:MAG: magnesium transporter [Bdellovibrionales bacterium GWB1_55_8]|nr:MAG: magnesium transporter [Bdellovibrionales bacterium GWB1_55_8]
MKESEDNESEIVDEKSELDRVQEHWPSLSHDDRLEAFKSLPRADAEELFISLGPSDQRGLLEERPWPEKRSWVRLLAPDDAADLIQEFPSDERGRVISLLDPVTAKEITALLAYAEDEAGGLMNPRFIRLRPDVTVDVAIRYLRAQARGTAETIHYGYVLDPDQRLLGTVSFRELLLESPEKLVSDIMTTDLVTLPEQMDQEQVSREFAKYDLASLPVVDDHGRMKGIVTVDDVVDVVEEEATEDIQKLGGSEALDEPYMQISLLRMIRKRAIWLVVLFFGEMLTTIAMGHYELDIQRAVVLALFIPLIISSGGNSGSQATSMIIRAIALQEIRLRDWWRVLMRELLTGLSLGAILGTIGFLRIMLTPAREDAFGAHYMQLGLTVSASLVGVVLLGSVTGAMLPFLLRRIGLDPAAASAPLVATLVDVTGLILYFTFASLILGGALF